MMKPPVRIAFIMPWPEIGGVERATITLILLLRARGYESLAYCTPDAGVLRAELHASGIVTALYDPQHPSYRHPLRWLASSWKLAADFRRRGVGIVHCADLLAALYAGMAGRMARLPVVCHIRCCYPDLSGVRRFLWPVTRFVFVSEAARRAFGWQTGADRGEVAYDAIDLQVVDRGAAAAGVREEFGIAPDRKIVGMAAWIGTVKDHPTFIRAARIIAAARPGTVFLVVGGYRPDNQAHYDAVRRLVRDSGLESVFFFTGFRRDVARLFAAMDVSVLCTHSEGLGLVILESMAQGTPVVGTAVEGVAEIVKDGENGLLHAHEDADDLAACILRILRDSALAEKLARAASQYVNCNFSEQALFDKIDRLYRSLIPARRTM